MTTAPVTDRHSALWGTKVIVLPLAALSVARLADGVDPVALAIATHLVVGAWLVGNAWCRVDLRRGATLLVVGGVANLLAICANGAMPVRGAPFDPSTGVLDDRHLVATDSVRIELLGDWIRLAAIRTVVSPGDILMLVGLLSIAHRLVQRPSPREICIESAGACSLEA